MQNVNQTVQLISLAGTNGQILVCYIQNWLKISSLANQMHLINIICCFSGDLHCSIVLFGSLFRHKERGGGEIDSPI